MIRIQLCFVYLLAVGLSTVGCSGSDELEAASSAPILSVFEQGPERWTEAGSADHSGESQDPVVESVTFEPANPVGRAPLRAIAKVSKSWTSLQYEWTLNGEDFGRNSAQVLLPTISTGDEIGVRVIPFRSGHAGAPFELHSLVRNQKPRLRGLSIERVDAGDPTRVEGEIWRAAVRAEDSDGDRLEIEYRWLVNGRESEIEGEFYPASDLEPGDHLEVRARVYDGKAWSTSVRSGEIEIGHSLPIIVSVPPRPDRNGYFRYRVEVKDSRPDPKLHFALRASPRGMRIDESTGEVTWRPDSDQAGRHAVEVVVRDESGGEATQSFSLALISVGETEPGPAAPR
jgi:hypothetical protein